MEEGKSEVKSKKIEEKRGREKKLSRKRKREIVQKKKIGMY